MHTPLCRTSKRTRFGSTKRSVSLACACLVLCAVNGARAEGVEAASRAAGADARAEERARQLVTEADRRFRGGDAAAAIPLLEQAYELGRWPGCLLNLAMTHHALSHCELALSYYRRYSSADPYSDRRDEVAEAMRELEHHCGEPAPSAAALPMAEPAVVAEPPGSTSPVAPDVASQSGEQHVPAHAPAAPPEDRHDARRKIGWSLLGAGAVSGVAAGVFAVASQRKNLEADHFTSFNADDPRARGVNEAGVRYNRLAWGFGVGAAALLGSGAALLLVPAPADTSLAVSVIGGPLLSYQGTF